MSKLHWMDYFTVISDEFFKCNPDLDTGGNRIILEEGFLRGWYARDSKSNQTEISEE